MYLILRFKIFCCLQLLACSVNAVSLALINSGIEMKFLIAAVSCMVDEEGVIIVDPDDKQLMVCISNNLCFLKY